MFDYFRGCPDPSGDGKAHLKELLASAFPGQLHLEPAGGAGNHHTFRLSHAEGNAFVRVENGPEGDSHLAVESRVLGAVARTGVAVPQVYFTDATRQKVPFGVQVLTFFDCSDLNRLHQQGKLSLLPIARAIGEAIARWQSVPVRGLVLFSRTPEGSSRGIIVGMINIFTFTWNGILNAFSCIA